MTELRQRLEELAGSAAQQARRPPPAVVARRGRRRRLRRAGGVALLLVAVAGGVVSADRLLATGRDTTLAPPPATRPCPAADGVGRGCAAGGVDTMPTRLAPRSGARLPRSPGDLARAAALAKGSISRADALYQRGSTVGAERPGPVYVLGADGAFYRLDLGSPVDFVRDAAKRPLSEPLTPTALSPDGGLAAFPQPESVLVADLTTAHTRRFAVPGVNRQVLWRSSGSLLVGQAGATFAVDLASGAVTRVAARLALGDAAAGPAGADRLVELPAGGPLTVREWVLAGAAPRRQVPIGQGGLAPYRVSGWRGPGWRSGDLVVRAGQGGSGDSSDGPLVAVVDLRTASVVRLLVPPAGRGACTPLGWLDDHTALLRTDREGVVAWDVGSGAVTSVAAPFDGALAVAPH
jgi:hypothetical protein